MLKIHLTFLKFMLCYISLRCFSFKFTCVYCDPRDTKNLNISRENILMVHNNSFSRY